MLREVYALFVHGVGQQSSDFAADARQYLRAALAEKGVKLFSCSVHWAPLADKLESAFLKDVEARGSNGKPLQKLVIGTLSDALAYQSNERLREQIAYVFDYEYTRLRASEVHVFAHSLGGLIATDWLRTRTKAPIAKLHTFGCNVGLFNLGKSFDCPGQVRAPGSWVNYFDADDMLGYPLRVAPELSHVRDVEVSVGGWLTGWTGLSHTAYWADKKFWTKTIPAQL